MRVQNSILKQLFLTKMSLVDKKGAKHFAEIFLLSSVLFLTPRLSGFQILNERTLIFHLKCRLK